MVASSHHISILPDDLHKILAKMKVFLYLRKGISMRRPEVIRKVVALKFSEMSLEDFRSGVRCIESWERTFCVVILLKVYSLQLHQALKFSRKLFIMGFCFCLTSIKMPGKRLRRNSFEKNIGENLEIFLVAFPHWVNAL